MTDLVSEIKRLYTAAYLSDAADRVARMDKLVVALRYATTGYQDDARTIVRAYVGEPRG